MLGHPRGRPVRQNVEQRRGKGALDGVGGPSGSAGTMHTPSLAALASAAQQTGAALAAHGRSFSLSFDDPQHIGRVFAAANNMASASSISGGNVAEQVRALRPRERF